MAKMWTAVRGNGYLSIVSVIADTEDKAQAEVDRALRGRPGGRHQEWKKWDGEGRKVIQQTAS